MLKFGNTYLNFGGTYLSGYINKYNPLNLPINTIRVKFQSGYTPTMGDTQTLVDSNNNVWDIYYNDNNWDGLFNESSKPHNLLEVLGANTTNVTSMLSLFLNCKALTKVALFDTSNVTDMKQMFYHCDSLTSVPLFDTSSVIEMNKMFYGCLSLTVLPLFDTSNVVYMEDLCNSCSSLTFVPLFDTSNVTDIGYAFYDCNSVQIGALALYQQASTQATPPISHDGTFYNCGSNTQTGSAELAQIPIGWK